MKVLVKQKKTGLKTYEGWVDAEEVIIIDDKTAKSRYKITDDMEIEEYPETTSEKFNKKN